MDEKAVVTFKASSLLGVVESWLVGELVNLRPDLPINVIETAVGKQLKHVTLGSSVDEGEVWSLGIELPPRPAPPTEEG